MAAKKPAEKKSATKKPEIDIAKVLKDNQHLKFEFGQFNLVLEHVFGVRGAKELHTTLFGFVPPGHTRANYEKAVFSYIGGTGASVAITVNIQNGKMDANVFDVIQIRMPVWETGKWDRTEARLIKPVTFNVTKRNLVMSPAVLPAQESNQAPIAIKTTTTQHPESPDVSLPVVGGSTGEAIVTGTYSNPAGVVLELGVHCGSICRHDCVAVYRDGQIATTGIIDRLRHYDKDIKEMKFDGAAKEHDLLCGATVRLDREFTCQVGDRVRAVGKYIQVNDPEEKLLEAKFNFVNGNIGITREDVVDNLRKELQNSHFADWVEAIVTAVGDIQATGGLGIVSFVNVNRSLAQDKVPEYVTVTVTIGAITQSVLVSKVNDCYVHTAPRCNVRDLDALDDASPSYEGLYSPVEVLHVLRNCSADNLSNGEKLNVEEMVTSYTNYSPAFSHETIELRRDSETTVAIYGLSNHLVENIGVLYIDPNDCIVGWTFWEKENPVHAKFKNYLHSTDFDPLSPGYKLTGLDALNRINDLLAPDLDAHMVREQATQVAGIKPSDLVIFNRQGRQVIIQVAKSSDELDSPRHAGTMMIGQHGDITTIQFFKPLVMPKSAHNDGRRTSLQPTDVALKQGAVAPRATIEEAEPGQEPVKPSKFAGEITGVVRGDDFTFKGPYSHPFNLTGWIEALSELPSRWKAPVLEALTELMRVSEEAAHRSHLKWADTAPHFWYIEISTFVRYGRQVASVKLLRKGSDKPELVNGYSCDVVDYGCIDGLRQTLVYGHGQYASVDMLQGVPTGLYDLAIPLLYTCSVDVPDTQRLELEKELRRLYPDDQNLILVRGGSSGDYRLVGQHITPNQVVVFTVNEDRIVSWKRQARTPGNKVTSERIDEYKTKPKAEVMRPAPQGRFENLLGYQAQSLAGLWFGASNDPSHPRNVLSNFVERIHERCKDGGTENALVFDVDVTCGAEGYAGTFTISAHVFGTDEKFSSIASITEAVTEA